MTINDAREMIQNWMYCEFEYEYETIGLGEDNTKIAIAFSQYEGQGDGVFVNEQWYADLIGKKVYCELNDEVCIVQKFGSLDELVASLDFDYLIGEADNYIREHIDSFKEA